jgi:[protein-PII] uridylyltransferase
VASTFTGQPLFFNQQQFLQDLQNRPRVRVFKDAILGVNTHFDRRFIEGNDIRQLVAERAAFVDMLLHYAWHQYQWDDDISLIAVGGYGRGELHPHSDIDILILLDNSAEHKYTDELRDFITFLWDIGLEIGSSVRTLDQCIALAEKDITVATNVIEARRIAGNDKLRDQLQVLTGPQYMWSVPDFFDAKWEEQKQRHAKHNNTEYNLEPNIKNSPGGLRDIQMINWVAKRYFSVQTLVELQGQDFFTEHEFGILRRGEEFLWRVRYGLHMIAGRADERLLFEYQRELATLFDYSGTDKGLAVEQFMHQYYRTVLTLHELNDVLLQYLDEAIHREQSAVITPINARFQLHNRFIEVTHDKVFEETPSALLEIFLLMGRDRSIEGVRAATIRLIRESRWLINDDFRRQPHNNKLFMELFSLNQDLPVQLRRMKRYGILGRYLPEFGQITGQMQHDLFHRYTVDAHTLLVIENMSRFYRNDAGEDFRIASHVVKRLAKPELLYIAGLYHDIGKGRGGDHSVLGAQDARQFCERHGLNRRETRLVVWLVEKHLLMSYVSQKQDISDPDVIHNFALQVGDQSHLDYLYTMTVADMSATNPEIYNTWRASLMRQLYMETKRALRRGLENTVDQQDIIEETQQQAIYKLADKGLSEEHIRDIWGDMGDEYFLREGHLDIAWQTEAIARHDSTEPLVLIRETTNNLYAGATQIFVRVMDEQNVFLAVATALSQLGLNIQDARVYSSASGYTIDTFYVLDENDQPIGDNPRRVAAIERELKAELSLVGDYSTIISRRTPRRLKQFAIPTRAHISNDMVSGYTVLEVISPDRPGLLATIGRIFMDLGIRLQNAKISTLGERVEDVFFITDTSGHPLSDPEVCERLQKTICRELDLRVEQSNL